jgi:hypothetical protein
LGRLGSVCEASLDTGLEAQSDHDTGLSYEVAAIFAVARIYCLWSTFFIVVEIFFHGRVAKSLFATHSVLSCRFDQLFSYSGLKLSCFHIRTTSPRAIVLHVSCERYVPAKCLEPTGSACSRKHDHAFSYKAHLSIQVDVLGFFGDNPLSDFASI